MISFLKDITTNFIASILVAFVIPTILSLTGLLPPEISIPWVLFFAFFLYQICRYYRILGGINYERGTAQHDKYLVLANSLRDSSRKDDVTLSTVYSSIIKKLLRRIDKLYGDDINNTSSHQRKKDGEVPIWTYKSYDMSLKLALLYPLAVLFIIWVGTGYSELTQQRIGFGTDYALGSRVLVLANSLIFLICILNCIKSPWITRILWLFGAFVVFAVIAFAGADKTLFVSTGPSFGTQLAFGYESELHGISRYAATLTAGLVVVFAITGAYLVPGTAAVVGAIAAGFATALLGNDVLEFIGGNVNLYLSELTSSIRFTLTFVPLMALLFAIAAAFAYALSFFQSKLPVRRQSSFQFIFTIFCPLLIVFSAYYLTSFGAEPGSLMLLMIFGLITLVNAPFDFISVSATRYLLRKGLGKKGKPLIYGFFDFIFALILFLILTLTTVMVIQLFNEIVILAGGESVIDLAAVLKGISNSKPWLVPEYYWIYFMVFSTIMPSMVHFCVGCLSVMRGLPILNEFIGGKLPLRKKTTIVDTDREWMAFFLALQLIIAIPLGLILTALMIYLSLTVVLPYVGFNVLQTTQSLYDLNLPLRFINYLFPNPAV